MNVAQAKEAPIVAILQHGALSKKANDREAWYLSPWRKEQTASFHVTFQSNLWCDFGDTGPDRGGNAFDLVIRHLKESGEGHAAVDALRWLRNMGFSNGLIPIMPKPGSRVKTGLHGWRLLNSGNIHHPALEAYVEHRGIPVSVASRHLQEAFVENPKTERRMYALALRNEEEGYEIRSPFVKSSIKAKGISFIRGQGPTIHVFEGRFDFLSILAQQDGKALDGECLGDKFTFTHESSPRLCFDESLYQTLYMDGNDDTGIKAHREWQDFCRTKEGLLHLPMNKQYMPHKDVNAAHMFELGVS